MNSLAGIRILDLTRLLQGPYATQLLANMGAEVIKIERPPEGDYARTLPPYLARSDGESIGAIFAKNNRGKQSVGLNFDDPRGRAGLLRLIETADVLIESFRPGMLARRGLDYPSVHAHNPRLVYCSLSGYGQTGTYAQRAGHDINYLALAGVLNLNGARDAPPTAPPVQIADLAGGMMAAMQILAALVERQQTGEGKFLEVALFDAAVGWMQTVLGASYEAEQADLTRGVSPLSGEYPCYAIYETADGGFMSLGALEPNFWRAFCDAVGRAEWHEIQFDAAAIPTVAALFREHTRGYWIELGQRADCCLEPLLLISETLAHPHVLARGLAGKDGRRVPRLGEDTVAVMRGVGYDESAIEELREAGVVVC